MSGDELGGVQTANEEDSSTNELNVFSASRPSPMGLDPSTPSNNVKRQLPDRASVPSSSVGAILCLCA